jgi:hypothetical protein
VAAGIDALGAMMEKDAEEACGARHARSEERGSKALAKAIRRSFGRHTPIQRCRIHKARNIMERLSPALHASVRRALRQAWELDDAASAEKLIRNLAQRLERDAPGVSTNFSRTCWITFQHDGTCSNVSVTSILPSGVTAGARRQQRCKGPRTLHRPYMIGGALVALCRSW